MNNERSAVIFGSFAGKKSILLVREALRIASNMEGFRIAAICDTSQEPTFSKIFSFIKQIVQPFVSKIFDWTAPFIFTPGLLWNLRTLGWYYGVKVIVPPNKNVNDPAFITYLKEKLKPTYALSFGCGQVFSKDLLKIFKSALNSHSGLLPRYRGWATTQWSIYYGERTSGFSYHYMTEDIDAGTVLFNGHVQIDGHPLEQVDIGKIKEAAKQLDSVLAAFMADSPGMPQISKGQYFSREDEEKIITVAYPSQLTWSEIERRMRAFGSLWIKFNTRYYKVTKLRPETGRIKGVGAYAFVTADGITVTATRFGFLPIQFYSLLYRFIYRPRSIRTLTD
jgi:methionyl-tRNA formyltransferase